MVGFFVLNLIKRLNFIIIEINNQYHKRGVSIMAGKNNQNAKSIEEVFNYELIKHPEENKSHLQKRKERIKEGEMECADWWLCHRSPKK